MTLTALHLDRLADTRGALGGSEGRRRDRQQREGSDAPDWGGGSLGTQPDTASTGINTSQS